MVRSSIKEQCKCLCHTSICIFSMSQGRLMYLLRVTTMYLNNCNIISYNAKLIHREDGNYFMAIATVSTQGQNTPILQKYMKTDVRIIVSNKTLWQQVFG